ncbi:MAG TPA: maltose alpha-D-glucosyltransferase [Planctomycetota bacterium]|nr:maltose alpha-D-glucosyltransferase [Planctomycetota bacterium]
MTDRTRCVGERRLSIVATALCLALAWLTSCSFPGSSERDPTTPRLAEAHETGPQWASAEYVGWLERRSMLQQSRELAPLVSGQGLQWQHEYAEPQPRAVVQKASVWVLGYPGAVITPADQSVIGTWGDPALWEAFDEIGINLLHTGPVKRSGGIVREAYTPTIDGWFDRISLEIDPALGTEEEYRRMVAAAEKAGGLIAGDLVPLHTGKGADYLLALRAYGEYPGMYVMVEIHREDWGLLPRVGDEWQTALVSNDVADELTGLGYLPGRISPADADPAVRSSSGWSATGEIPGVDGKVRRWVFLHVFKPGQPVLNWLDPTSAAQQAVDGDVVRTVVDLGAKVVRMDAVPFLGLAPRQGSSLASNYEHPLSILGTNYLAFLIRKLGGWSFQELNVPFDSLKRYMAEGPDLSYDFYTRTEGLHSLLTRDAALLRLAYGFLLEAGIQPIGLVHDLQNHDEITYQLVPLDHLGDKVLDFNGGSITARELREQTLDQLRRAEAGEAAPYNLLYRPSQDGLATTYAGFVAAALGVRDLDLITPDQVKEIRRGHLLLAFANAMQPGVFSLSGWDLMGALPLPRQSVAGLLQDGDYRWINRGGIDLMDLDPEAGTSRFGLPRARTLYGSLPEQLKDPDSFASQLRQILAARKKYHIAEGELLAVPDVAASALCVLVLRLPEESALGVTALNFGQKPIRERIDLDRIEALRGFALAGRPVVDSVSGEAAGEVDSQGGLSVALEGWSGKTLIIGQPTAARGAEAR